MVKDGTEQRPGIVAEQVRRTRRAIKPSSLYTHISASSRMTVSFIPLYVPVGGDTNKLPIASVRRLCEGM